MPHSFRNFVLAGSLGLVACGRGLFPETDTPVPDDGAAYWPSAEWRTATPAAVGLDARRLGDLVGRLQSNRIPGFHSLVIVRYGYVGVNEYFNNAQPTLPHTLQSVTKSVTSLLVGIAVDQGKISRLDGPVIDYFPEYPNLQNLDARKAAMSAVDLLTMRTGLDWSENYSGNPLDRLNTYCSDWLQFVLDWPMRDAPGARWEYNGGA